MAREGQNFPFKTKKLPASRLIDPSSEDPLSPQHPASGQHEKPNHAQSPWLSPQT